MRLASFDESLFRELQNQEFAEAYLLDAYEESVDEFLIALRKYIQANGGMGLCAEKCGLAREALYRTLSETGNPGLRSIRVILDAYGIRLAVRLGADAEMEKTETNSESDASRDGIESLLPALYRTKLDRLAAQQGTTPDILAQMLLASGIAAMEAGKEFGAVERGAFHGASYHWSQGPVITPLEDKDNIVDPTKYLTNEKKTADTWHYIERAQ